jgi:hypothetical protein
VNYYTAWIKIIERFFLLVKNESMMINKRCSRMLWMRKRDENIKREGKKIKGRKFRTKKGKQRERLIESEQFKNFKGKNNSGYIM